MSHHGNDPEKIVQNAKVNQYYVHLFSRFVKKLADTQDGDGRLLDHALVFYGSGMSDGDSHGTDPLPLVAVGRGAGQGDRHVEAPARTPIGNLWVGVANKFGIQIERLGESTGVLEL